MENNETKKTNKTVKPVENNETKKYIVKTQVPNYCGVVAGVQFAYGKAEVQEGWILEWFKEKGYSVEEMK